MFRVLALTITALVGSTPGTSHTDGLGMERGHSVREPKVRAIPRQQASPRSEDAHEDKAVFDGGSTIGGQRARTLASLATPRRRPVRSVALGGSDEDVGGLLRLQRVRVDDEVVVRG